MHLWKRANVSVCMVEFKITTNNRTIHLAELKEQPVDHHRNVCSPRAMYPDEFS